MPGTVQSASWQRRMTRGAGALPQHPSPLYRRSPALILFIYYRFENYYVEGNKGNRVMLNQVLLAMSLDIAEKTDSHLDGLEAAEFGQNFEVQNPIDNTMLQYQVTLNLAKVHLRPKKSGAGGGKDLIFVSIPKVLAFMPDRKTLLQRPLPASKSGLCLRESRASTCLLCPVFC